MSCCKLATSPPESVQLRVASATSSPKPFSGLLDLLDFEIDLKGELIDFEELSELA
jgi:hypothetical protein